MLLILLWKAPKIYHLLKKTGQRAECIVSLHFHFEKVLSIVSFCLKRKRSRRRMAFYNKFFFIIAGG